MRKILNLFLVLFPIVAICQTQTENYIKSAIYKVPSQTVITAPTITQANQNVTYFDGLGRPLQEIAYLQSGSGKDIVKPIEYDAFGRSEKEYLPYVSASAGSLNYISTALTDVKNYTQYAGQNPFNQRLFEASPLNRPLKQAAPGSLSDWALNSGHEIKFDYQSNIAGEVKLYTVITTWDSDKKIYNTSLGNNDGTVFYEPNQLYKTINYDENTAATPNEINGSTVEFRNKQNQIVLKRTYETGIKHDTYYVYDDFGNLTYVLPPQSQVNPNIITTGYNNFSTYIYQNVFSGASGGGGVNIDITNNTLTVAFSGGFSPSMLSTTPQDLPTTPCMLPDMYLGTICTGNYSVVIIGGKLKLNYITGGTATGFNGTFSFPLSTNCSPQAPNVITQIPVDDISTAVINSANAPLYLTATNSIRLIDGFHAQAGSTFSAKIISGNTVLDNLCYQYKYDGANRLVEKKLPGKDWEYIVYDILDRPVLTQDANLRAKKKWLFTKYDALNRPVYTGEYFNDSQITRANVQSLANGTTLFETRQATAQAISGTSVNYTNVAFPNSGIDLFTINYYDDYLNINLENGIAANAVSYGVTPISNAQGLNTCFKIRVLETANWITNVIYYDNKSRTIYNYNKNNFLNIESTVKSQFDFTGKVLETTSTHQKGTNAILTIVDTFTYDNTGRQLTQQQKINTQTPEIIVSNSYDDLGQLITKGVGGKISQSRLQTIDFTYNIRGWLKAINDSDTNNASITMGAGDLFGFQINYNNPSSGKALYNGNISQVFWKTANEDTSLKNYNYSYDNLNRLVDATDNLGKFSETMKYDKNGNITYLKRMGEVVGDPIVPNINVAAHFGVMDDLTYTYDSGNKLMKVADAAPIDQYGFKDDAVNQTADTENDYKYDNNGNMIGDTNKGITDITYNHLNLPSKITLNTGVIDYKYDATGVKQQKIVNGITTDYAGGFIYENNNLKFLSQPEGYITNNNETYDYIYQYRDHLENVRLSYGDKDNNGSISINEIIEENSYYPFGLKQKGYNNGTILGKGNSTAQKYKFQGQERQDELGLNWDNLKWRNYDPAIGRFMSVDPLAPDFPQWSPYVFSGNLVVVSKELEGMEPKFMIDNGRLTSGMVSLLNAAYGYSISSLEETSWVLWSDPRVVAWYRLMGSNISATTKGYAVAHDGGYNNGKGSRNDDEWFGLIAHEQSHREDFENQGPSFYIKYAMQGITGYENIDTEAKAFKNGSDDHAIDYADKLLAYKKGEVMEIFKNGGLTNNQKAQFLQSTGARFRRDVILNDRISYANSRLSNISKEITKVKMTPGVQKFYNRYINYYNKIIQDATDEQDEITKKYGY
ncbi:DUF6443 domain-containing protein [Flavobacterium sp. N1736]|uniref:DUF6443 domain-containing protein n=1 Tax=Flavobacterium sp. N1736 TaxID=2986823 RepID=UPI002224915B|nr:DUF6443 domain-containing protein [Flavobacterium sp. N1736]